MSKTLSELAALVGGKVVGDPSLVIRAARALHEAGDGDVTFVEQESMLDQLLAGQATAAIVDATLPSVDRTVIVVDDPFWAFVTAAKHLDEPVQRAPLGVHPRAFVHPAAQLGRDVSVYPGAFIDDGARIGDGCEIHSGASVGRNCRLGNEVVLHPNVVLYPRTKVGDHVTIHAGAVIGADGFGYRMREGRHVKVPQLGHVEIGDDVEIGACSTVDRGTFGATVIGEGTKIDNQVMVGHNCRLGKHNLLVSQTGFAGSCMTGDYVVTAGQAGIADHVSIGTAARIGAQAGVMTDVPEGGEYIGSPAIPDGEKKRQLFATKRLPEMRKTLREMEKKLARLDGQGHAMSGPHQRGRPVADAMVAEDAESGGT